jgi:hypothetical protein
MAKSQSKELAVDRPERFLQRERVAQQVGVVLLVLFVLGGAAGLFGDGPLSHTTVTNGPAMVSFERFTRQTLRTALEVDVDAPGPARVVEIRIGREFIANIDFLAMRPVAALKRLDDHAAVFEVPSANGRAILELQYKPMHPGLLRIAIGVEARPAAELRQIVFF